MQRRKLSPRRAQRARSLSSAAAAAPSILRPTAEETTAVARSRLLEASSEKRKMYPITTGFLDYFPDAVAEAAMVSYLGNEKHNPGHPLHWARGKSMDHADCIARHLVERGGFDGKIRHSAAMFWRAGANLQEELEREYGLATPRGARQE